VGIRISEGVGNWLTQNSVTRSCFDGILVEAAASDTWLIGNVATGNGDDGLDIEDPSAKLLVNRALANGDYGIEAVPGVRGAGNVAAGNGNPDQCLGITCILRTTGRRR
jgi:hypothetical protein